ncbi:WcbI family polysaccharide biosynthesis putative acetyltransferase [Thiocystis violacea]|uniref:WcbI family polysaccharide biosynthesis putative acetyltransferase n=1 Tax=Thiocystis violacea TaxID=13725 RepID=UPI0019088339|nr:WcbI family polysaccharide biosynthesis putative acetyltransferase [Thiocystis violacea]MBK1724679.1 hypothetical protein [Thiocystis violacea]
MKLALIGNCQVTPMKVLIEATLPEVSCTAWEVFAMSEADCAAAAEALAGMDAILAQPLVAPRYSRLVAADLRADHGDRRPLLFIHNLHFDGTLPDCTYVGKLGARLPSPIAGYHSRIVRDAFLAGCSAADAEARLRAGAGIDVPAAWTRSLGEFRTREQEVDIPFAEEMEAHVRRENSFHVFNHPTMVLIARYTEKAMARLLERPGLRLADGLPDMLVRNGAWPVWPWVAEAVGLSYAMDAFTPPAAAGRDSLSPREFVAACYAIYAAHPRED